LLSVGPAGIQEYDGDAWNDVGALTAFGRKPIALDASQVPYVLTCEMATVSWFDGDDWQPLGGMQTSWSNVSNLALHPDGTPYVVYGDIDSFDGDAQSYELSVQRYYESAWELVGSEAFATSSDSPADIAISSTGTLYVAFVEPGRDRIAVMTSSGDGWTELGDGIAVEGGITSTSQHPDNALPSLALSPDGTPHVVYVANVDEEPQSFVARWTGTEWQSLTVDGFAHGDFYTAELAIAADGTPYVAYIDAAAQDGSEIVIMQYGDP
jgi:hypothetical protein